VPDDGARLATVPSRTPWNKGKLAIAPTRGVAAFFVMNEVSMSGFNAAVTATNQLIGQLAPR
jgi:hypothetical protein